MKPTPLPIQHPPGTESARSLRIVLIRPSKYDDEGWVIRHFRGVLPSNTLACLHALSEDVKQRQLLGAGVRVRVQTYDDSVQKIPVDRIIRSHRPPYSRTVVALVGVQSNQFPRAADLARRFRRGGLPVLIGGFHVSGTMALLPEGSPEIHELMDLGVTVVLGEVEESWGSLLQDALHGRLRPLYSFLDAKPDLRNQPVPMAHPRYLRRFVAANFATIDCGRGCPYRCSFCTIINVQGHEMRFRSAELVVRAVRENYRRHKIDYYFFTDDNFARNRCWREIFEGLARLREEERIPVRFMMQVDTQAYRIPDFARLAARAGCTQVFIGLESINPNNLKSAGKGQNRVQDYRTMIGVWRQAKIATHAAYIIGFPHDTPDSVAEDIERLKRDLRVEQASFFMLTPLPGSRDHLQMVREGRPMDPDLNNYDAFHQTTEHPNFRPGEWTGSYRKAWDSFYSFEYMREVLLQASPENYWNVFRNFFWYRNSVFIEDGHPMVHGFFRLKPRRDRRPGFPVESRWKHLSRRLAEWRRLARAWLSLILEMEELWLQ
ncbi:MAG: radical SAM protein, partial [Acidobacteriota bacterium]